MALRNIQVLVLFIFFILLVNFLSIWYQKCFFFLPVIFLQRMWVYDIVINIFFWDGSYFIHNRVISWVVLWILPLFCPSGHLLSPLNRPFVRGRSRLGQGLPKSSSSSSSRSPSLLGPFLAAALKQIISSSYLINSWNLLEYILNIWIFRYCNTFCTSCFAIKWHLSILVNCYTDSV